MFRRFIPLLAAGLLAGPTAAHQYELGSLVIGHPWSRPTPAGAPMGVAYLSITNQGTEPDALIGASSPASSGVQFHQTTISEGMARMRPLGEIEIEPGATVKIEPGSFHLMLVALKAPLAAGKSVPLTLQFLRAGSITVELSIEARDAPPAAETAMSQSLGVVTVVARRPSSLPTQIPTTIEGVSGETVARTVNATDSEDALKYFPSLNVRKRYIGDFDHAVLASRASGTQNSARSLVYADGILLSNLLGNGAAFTPRWGLVTPEEIERVDVLYGPFSAAYPGNSVGAVVDYVTRMPDALELHAALSTFVEDFDVYETTTPSAAGRPAPRTATRAEIPPGGSTSTGWTATATHRLRHPAVLGRRARQRRHSGQRRAAGPQSTQPGLVVVRRDQPHRDRAGSRQAQVRA